MRLYKKDWEKEKIQLSSSALGRTVEIDAYFPTRIPFGQKVEMLLFNDGQILEEMDFFSLISSFYKKSWTTLLVVIGIHANKDRIFEYGTAGIPNYKGEGNMAACHTQFVLRELIPFTWKRYPFIDNVQAHIAGFSLGGLSAFDIAWEQGKFFNKVGVFSGSFWWRSRDILSPYYNNDLDRIMLHKVNTSVHTFSAHQFFFECGTLDEYNDRNQNGVIDAIDDTQDIIRSLLAKGYSEKDICYYEIENGKHDISTWKAAMPAFLEWGWGKSS